MFSSLLAELIRATECDAKFIGSYGFDFPIMGLNCKCLSESRHISTRFLHDAYEKTRQSRMK